MLTRTFKCVCLALAILFVTGMLAGCAAKLPCPIGEDQVEQARAKAAAADKELSGANAKIAELEAQVASKQATVQELEAKIAELEQALAR